MILRDRPTLKKTHCVQTLCATEKTIIVFVRFSDSHFVDCDYIAFKSADPLYSPTKYIYMRRISSKSFKVIWRQQKIKKLEYEASKDRM